MDIDRYVEELAAEALGTSQASHGDINDTAITEASALLNGTGVRIMRLDGRYTIGVWSDLDRPEIRAALRTVGMDQLPLRYLDGPGFPMRYKSRSVQG